MSAPVGGVDLVVIVDRVENLGEFPVDACPSVRQHEESAVDSEE
jgi:hypothetical protein